MIRVQSSVISDHFKSRVLDEQATGQQVNESLETEDDMMTELNGGALTDFFHSYSVLEEEVKADVSKEPEVNENSDLIHVQDFLNLTDHDLAGPRSISPKFKVNSGNPEVRDDVKMSVEGSDLYHEHPHVAFVSDVSQSKMNEATEAASNSAAVPSPPDSKLVKESSQPAESSPTSESSDLITPPVVSSPSPPSSTPASSTTLDSSSTSDAAPPPAFSPAEYEPSPEVQLSSEPSTTEPSISGTSTTEPSKKEHSSTERSSLSLSPEPVTLESSTGPAMDDVDDGADSLDNLFLELENLNILNDAVKALNKGPQVAEDRTDVIDDGYDADETNNIFTDLFQWFG